MKKTNKILSIIMAVLLMCLSMVCVSAEDSIIYDEDIDFFENGIAVCEPEETIENVDNIGNNEEIMPMAASGCPINVPGIGWTGSQNWYAAIARVQAGGHIEGWGKDNNVYLSESNARMLIGAAGLSVYGGVERDDYDHKYPHIHYVLNGSRHNSIRVSE